MLQFALDPLSRFRANVPRPACLAATALLLVALHVPALAQDEAADDFLAAYEPPVELYTTNLVESYELYRYSDDELAAEVFVPAFSELGSEAGFIALDLKDMLGHISQLDPGFESLALELASWEPPADATNTASVQLAMVHAFCGDPEMEDMPALEMIGDATSLAGDYYECIIYHPRNVPLACALIYAEDGVDDFGIMLLMAGGLVLAD